MVGAVCIMLFTSALFLLYDFFVRQEFLSKQLIMQAKRNYVRYVSHEVRLLNAFLGAHIALWLCYQYWEL